MPSSPPGRFQPNAAAPPQVGNSVRLLERLARSLPRTRRSAAMASLVAGWALSLVYDLATGTWHEPPFEQGPLRLLLPLLGFLPFLFRYLTAATPSDEHDAFREARRMTFWLAGTLALLILPVALGSDYDRLAAPLDVGALLVGRISALIATAGLATVLDLHIPLLRFRDRGAPSAVGRFFALLMAVGLILSQLLPPMLEEGALATNPTVYALGGVAALIAFVLAVRTGWVINLRKGEKWGLLGLSSLGFVASAAFLVLHQDADSPRAWMSFAPLTDAIAFVPTIALLFYYMIIFVTSLFALPTADAIDRRNREVTWLAGLARLLAESLDASELIDSAIATARDATAANLAWIELFPEGHPATPDHRDDGELLFDRRTTTDRTLARRLMQSPLPEGRPLRDAVNDSLLPASVERLRGVELERDGSPPLPIRSVAAAPLRHGDRLLGALYVTRERSDGFDRNDRVVLAAVADQIALALEHGALIQQSIEQERLRQEMLIAQDLQQRLLPRVMPSSPAYELVAASHPASMVGGDYYDVVSFNDHSLGLVIADVSGKGASAALYMGMAKGIVQSLSGSCDSPRDMLSRTNVALHGTIEGKWFVTMTCAQIDEVGRRLRIARAGHCPTILVRDGVGTLSRPTGIGLAIARPALFERNLELEEIGFAPGDAAVFISDGLAEARSSNGDEFGYDRLLETAVEAVTSGEGAAGIRDRIFAAIAAFVGDEPPHDDSTIVVLRWT